jgi:uncharacterized protein YsxB (DUF464 family)
MINVYIGRLEIDVSNHAKKNYICSSVSTGIILTINAIELFNKLDCIKYQLGEGLFHLEIIKEDETVLKLFDNLVFLLKDLSLQYKEHIKYKQED